jgi:hypothetical protein
VGTAGAALELELVAAISFVDGGCARAVTAREEVAVKSGEEDRAMQWRRRCFPSLGCAPLEIGLGFCRWGVRLRRTSCFEPPALTSLYSAGWRGLSSHRWAGRP